MEFGPLPNRASLELLLKTLIENYGRPDVVSTVPRIGVWAWHAEGLLLTALKYDAEGGIPTTDAALYCIEEKFNEIDQLVQEVDIECDIWVHDKKKTIEELRKVPDEFFEEDENPPDYTPHLTMMRFLKRHLQNKIGWPDNYLTDEDLVIAVWYKRKTLLCAKTVWTDTTPKVVLDRQCPREVDEHITKILEKLNLDAEIFAEKWFKAIARDLIDEPDYESLGTTLVLLTQGIHGAIEHLQLQDATTSIVIEREKEISKTLEELRLSIEHLTKVIETVDEAKQLSSNKGGVVR